MIKRHCPSYFLIILIGHSLFINAEDIKEKKAGIANTHQQKDTQQTPPHDEESHSHSKPSKKKEGANLFANPLHLLGAGAIFSAAVAAGVAAIHPFSRKNETISPPLFQPQKNLNFESRGFLLKDPELFDFEPLPIWIEKAKNLPSNRSLRQANQRPMREQHLLSLSQFADLAATTLHSLRIQNDSYPVVHQIKDPVTFLQKKIFEKGDVIFLHGDFHGDIKSFMGMLQNLHAQGDLDDHFHLSSQAHLIFLGDYTDRGFYGMDVLATALLLKIKNPEQVTLVRGNHEDPYINSSDPLNMGYSFLKELKSYAPDEQKNQALEVFQTALQIYEELPAALLIQAQQSKSKHIIASHGGFDFGVDTRVLAKSEYQHALMPILEINRARFIDELKSKGVRFTFQDKDSQTHLYHGPLPQLFGSHASSGPFGFLWSDFIFVASETTPSFFKPSRGFQYNALDTRAYAKLMNTHAILRAHQHGPDTMQPIWEHHGIHHLGKKPEPSQLIANLKDSVFTFTVGLDNIYGEMLSPEHQDQIAYGRIDVLQNIEDWQLQIINTRF